MPLQRPAYSPKTETVQGDKILEVLAPNNTTPLTYRKGCRSVFSLGLELLDFFLYPLVMSEKKASSVIFKRAVCL